MEPVTRAREWLLVFLSFPVSWLIRLDFIGIAGRMKWQPPANKNPAMARAYSASKLKSMCMFGLGLIPLVSVVFARLLADFLGIMPSVADAIALTQLCLSIPLALVGLVIPFLALAVNLVFSKMGMGTIRHSLRHHGIRGLIFSALVILAIELTTVFLLKLVPSAFISQFAISVCTCSLSWSLLLIVVSGTRIAKVVRSFDPESALQLLRKRLQADALSDLRKENLRVRVHNALESMFNEGMIEVSYFQPERGTLICARKPGLVTNISLGGIRWLEYLIRNVLKRDDIKLEITNAFRLITDDDRQIAAVTPEVSKSQRDAISRLIRASIKVRRIKDRRDTLNSTLEEYKEAALSILRTENEHLMLSVLEGYGQAAKSYLNMGAQFNPSASLYFSGDWRVFRIIFHHLDDFVELAIQGKQTGMIGLISHWGRQQMQQCLSEQDVGLFERYLRIYQQMYWHSLPVKNAIGLHRAHFEPLHIFDYDLFRFGKTRPGSLSDFEVHLQFAAQIMMHLELLLRYATDSVDLDQTKQLLKLSSPSELLVHFRPELPFDRWEIEHQLKHDNPTDSEKKLLHDQIELARKLDEFASTYPARYSSTLHNAVSYLLEKLSYSVVTVDQIRPIFMEVWNRLGEWSSTFHWLEDNNTGRGRDRIWEYWEDSRSVQSRHPFWYPLLVLVMRGIYLQKQSEAPLEVLPLRFVDSYSKEIADFCSGVPRDVSLQWLLGLDSSVAAEAINTAFEAGKKKYKEVVAQSIRDAELSQDRIAKFESEVRRSFRESASILELLQSRNLVSQQGQEGKETEYRGIWLQQPKEAFIDQNRIEYFGFGGGDEGRLVGHAVNSAIVGRIGASLIAGHIIREKDLHKGLNWALEILKEAGVVPNVIFMPASYGLSKEMRGLDGFVSGWELEVRGNRHVIGEYSELPIYGYHGEGDHSVLVGQLEAIRVEVVAPLSVELREFTEEEIAEALRENQELTYDELRTRISSKVFLKMNVLNSSSSSFVQISTFRFE